MAVTDAYATAAEYRAAIRKDDTSDDTEVLNDITAVTRFLERALGRHFTKDTSAVARTYYPSNRTLVTNPEAENPFRGPWARINRFLMVDDIAVTPTSVIIDADRDGSFSGSGNQTLTAGTDYELWPKNFDKGSEPSPWTALYIPVYTTGLIGFVPQAQVQVTAQFGWPAVPAAVKRAVINLTAILRLESPRASRTVSSLGDVIGTSKEAQGIVDDLSKHYRRPAVYA